MKLTDPRWRELARLAKDSPADNSYTGARVARVRSSLRSMGLVRFFNQNGSVPSTLIVIISAGHGSPYDTCEITDAGRQALKSAPKRSV